MYLESNGKISILPLALNRPVTPQDMNLQPQQSKPLANVIIDGRILDDNLKSTGKNEKWVEKQLQSNGITNMKEVILATYDSNKNKLNVYRKYNKKQMRDIFE